MKRIFWAVMAALMACLMTPAAAMAQPPDGRIHDASGALRYTDLNRLNDLASELYHKYRIDVLVDINENSAESAQEYAERRYDQLEASDDGIMLAITEDDWYIYRSGRASEFILEEDAETLWHRYDSAATRYDGVRAFLYEVDHLVGPRYVPPAIPDERLKPRLVDDDDLLTTSQQSTLLAKLDEISERQNFDVVIVTVYSLDGWTATEYADDFFDYNGYGAGQNRDGILLLISMEKRDWAISTHGFGIPAFTDAGQEYMVDQFRPKLSSGDYASALTKFAELSDDFITQARTGDPYDVGNMPDDFKLTPQSYLTLLLYSLPIGFAVSLLVTSIAKRKLRPVRLQGTARNYVRSGSVALTDRRDEFLYNHVSRTARPKPSSSSGSSFGGGGSSSHSSSSGSSHGGSSGKF